MFASRYSYVVACWGVDVGKYNFPNLNLTTNPKAIALVQSAIALTLGMGATLPGVNLSIDFCQGKNGEMWGDRSFVLT